VALNGNLRNIGATMVGAALFFFAGFPALAAEPHEDLETARLEFSGISLFKYYSSSLDFVLKKDQSEVETRLEKMPFANIPQSLRETTDGFAISGIDLSYLIVGIDEDQKHLGVLLNQFRLKEAIEASKRIASDLSQAYGELDEMEQAVSVTGEELGVASTPAGSHLRGTYNEVMERIQRIREMLRIYENLLSDWASVLGSIAEQLKEEGVSGEVAALVPNHSGFDG